MGDATLKPSSGDDLVLSNDDGSAKIEVNENGTIITTGLNQIQPSSGQALALKEDGGTTILSITTDGDVMIDDSASLFVKGTGTTADRVNLENSGGNGKITIKNSSGTAVMVLPATFVGMIAPMGMSSPPTGWLACDGSAVSRTTYATLFSAIGTTWGAGDGSSTFNIPDLEGAFLRGTGSHGTSTMSDGNPFAGPSVGSFENDGFQNHTHESPRISTAGGSLSSGSNGVHFDGNAGLVEAVATGTPYLTAFSLDPPRLTDETRPFNAGVKYCIKF